MTESIELEHRLTIDGTAFEVFWLEAHETLDELNWLRCEISDHSGGPDPAMLVGKPLHVEISRRDIDQQRIFAGYVVEAGRTTTRGSEESGTRIVARQRLFRLSQRTNCRVFQEMTAPEITNKVLDDAGISKKDQRWQLVANYAKRTQTTQYRETDYDFLRRLLSEEGIAFAVDSSSGVDVVVFFDHDLDDIDGEKELPFRAAAGLRAGRDAITTISHERSTASGRVHLRDYDFEHPSLKLDAKAEGDDASEKALEVYVYPGRFTDPNVGAHYAKVLLDSLRARRELVKGTTNMLRLHPGRRFVLAEHPYEPLNQEYLVLSVNVSFDGRRTVHRMNTDRKIAERMTFEAIPIKNTTYRPPRLPRATLAGGQVALTTGAPGKEIFPDEHGRVKVLFPWDREGNTDDSSSRWIRTSQIPLGGAMLTPRVGWEVHCDFIDGDVDQPFVHGRFYNTVTPPPYSLPEHKTRMSFQTATTPGGGSTNEMRMEDKTGGEEMFMNASRDGSTSAGNNATEDVGNNETRTIGANQKLAITGSFTSKVGASQTLSVGANQGIHVSTFMVDESGSHSLAIGGSRNLTAGGDHKRTVDGSSTLTIGGMQVDLVAGSVDEETLATMDDSVGAALLETTASDRTMTVKGSRTETIGGAKVIIAGGGRALTVSGAMNQNVGGAILAQVGADRADTTAGDFIEIAGGAQIVKATNVVFQAKNLISVVMGASTITLTPASVSIAGVKINLDGDCSELGIVLDN